MIALDVGYGQLHERVRTDPRVTVLERTNARDLTPATLPYRPDLVVADVSFISLTLVLGAALGAAAAPWRALVLVKPQFEAGREPVPKGGVVRDPAVRAGAVERVARYACELGGVPLGAVDSGHPGPPATTSTCSRSSPPTMMPPSSDPLPTPPPSPATPSAPEPVAIRRCAVITHGDPIGTRDALGTVLELVRATGGTLLMPADERNKHPGIAANADPWDESGACDLVLVLGGDGTMLRALQRFLDTQVP